VSGAGSRGATAPGTLAGLARRWAALGYEALLVAALLLAAGFLTAPLVSPAAYSGQALALPSTSGRAISFAALFVLGAALYSWLWSEGRRTLPMKTWRIALCTATGAPVPRRAALVRYLAAWIGPLAAALAFGLLRDHGLGALAWPIAAMNWLAAFVDPERQFLHDRVAGTRIVNA
jgi:uncharacterized RDD family membrane protein YckC